MEKSNTQEFETRIAVRCTGCNRILAFKLGTASGFLQLKCPTCRQEIRVNLSMRRGRIYNRTVNVPLMLTFV